MPHSHDPLPFFDANTDRSKYPNRPQSVTNPKNEPTADEGPVEQTVRRYPLDLMCLHSDECSTLMTKGHHDADEFDDVPAGYQGAFAEYRADMGVVTVIFGSMPDALAYVDRLRSRWDAKQRRAASSNVRSKARRLD